MREFADLLGRALLFALPFLIVVLLVSGCEGPGKRVVSVASQAALLRAEFDQARARLLSLDLDTTERAIAADALVQFETLLERLDASGLDSAELAFALAVDGERLAQRLIDDIVGAYFTAHLAYVTYLDRTGAELDPFLKTYDESARSLHAELTAVARDATGRVDPSRLREFVSLALRAVAAFAL